MKNSKPTTLVTMKRKTTLKKIGITALVCVMVACMFMVSSFAANATGNVKSIVQTFLAYTVDIFVCIGALLGVWSCGQLALAFKNEDADSKSRAMMMLVVAAILIGVKLLADPIAQAAGFGGINGGFLSTK